jgi:uncharacterized protein YeaO (DUF488 family)
MRTIRLKRVYEAASLRDGARVLVDRVWPRGMSKQRARIDEWAKEVAPSTGLRKWFGHDPDRWTEFRRRYRSELKRPAQRDALNRLAQLAAERPVTLLYGTADERHNQAIVLKQLLARRR